MAQSKASLVWKCQTPGCKSLLVVDAEKPSHIHLRKIACKSCQRPFVIDLNEVFLNDMSLQTSKHRSTARAKSSSSTSLKLASARLGNNENFLGEYELGTFTASSITLPMQYQRPPVKAKTPKELIDEIENRIHRTNWQSLEDAQRHIIKIHETFHFYQDLYLGLPIYHDLIYDECIDILFDTLRFLPYKSEIPYPLDQWTTLSTPEYTRRIFLDLIHKIGQYRIDLSIFTDPEITIEWGKIQGSSGQVEEFAGKIFAASLLECQAALGTVFSIEKLKLEQQLSEQSKHFLSETRELYDLELLPEEYSAPLDFIHKTLPKAGGKKDREYLTMILADIALNIPPAHVINDLVDIGIPKIHFNSGARFISSVVLLQRLSSDEIRHIFAPDGDLYSLYLRLDTYINSNLKTPTKNEITNLWISELDRRLSLDYDNRRYIYRKKALEHLKVVPFALLKVNPPFSDINIPMILNGPDGAQTIGFPGRMEPVNEGKILGMDLDIKAMHCRLIDLIFDTDGIDDEQVGRFKCPVVQRCEKPLDTCKNGTATLEQLSSNPPCFIKRKFEALGISLSQFVFRN